MRVVMDVGGMQIDDVELVRAPGDAPGSLPNATVFAAIVCTLQARSRPPTEIVRVEVSPHRAPPVGGEAAGLAARRELRTQNRNIGLSLERLADT